MTTDDIIQTFLDLKRGRIKPSAVLGGGLKNPRAEAFEYLMALYILLDKTERGELTAELKREIER